MLQPKKRKYRKEFRGKMGGVASANSDIAFGEYGIKSLENGWIKSREIEAARRAITGHMKRKGKVWIRVFPDKPVSKKPAEVRMGKGKGAPDHWVAPVRPGRILFEVGNVSKEDAQQALVRAAAKLPIRTRFVERVETV